MLVTLGIIVTLAGMVLALWADRLPGSREGLQSLGGGCFIAGLAMLAVVFLPIA